MPRHTPPARPARLQPRRRARLLFALLSALTWAACSGPPPPSEKPLRLIKIQHNWLKDAALAGIYCAAENGYYKEVGLSVEVIPGGANVDPVVPVVSGGATVGIHTNATTVLLAKSRGVPIKVIATQYQKSPLGFVSKASTGIHDLNSLKGRRVGVIPSSVAALELVLQLNHLRREDVQQVVVSAASSMPLLLEDKIDAFIGFETNQPVQLELSGIKSSFLSFDDLGYKQEAYPFFVSEESMKNDAETLRHFVEATRRGWEYALANPEQAARLSVNKYTEGMSLDKETEVARRQAALMRSELTERRGLLYMDKATWVKTNELLLNAGLLQSEVNLDGLLTWQLLAPASAGE